MGVRGLSLPVLLATLVVVSAAKPLKIDLQKRTLDLDSLNAQHAFLRQRYLGASLNGGDDIPLLDFMDAQASPIVLLWAVFLLISVKARINNGTLLGPAMKVVACIAVPTSNINHCLLLIPLGGLLRHGQILMVHMSDYSEGCGNPLDCHQVGTIILIDRFVPFYSCLCLKFRTFVKATYTQTIFVDGFGIRLSCWALPNTCIMLQRAAVSITLSSLISCFFWHWVHTKHMWASHA